MVLSSNETPGLRYVRVADSLRRRILDGECRPGERLPRQHDMAKEYNVAFTTLKHALDVLEREGYVVRKVGQGTYAALPEKRDPLALIVDDEESVRLFFMKVLADSGWRGTPVKSGEMALKVLDGQRFDAIFLDLIMPGLNGAETFRHIRQADPEAYVVIVTGHPDSALMSEALEIGPFAVMKKPCALEDIRMVLGSLVTSLETAPGESR